MSGSYTAFASLNVRTNAPQVLAQIARGLGMVDTRIKATDRSLQALVGRFSAFGRAEQSTRNLAREMGDLRQASQGAARAAETQTRALDRNATAADRMASAANRALSAMRSLASLPPASPFAPGSAGRIPTRVVGGAGYQRGERLGEMASLGLAARAGQSGLARIARDAGALQNEQSILRAQTGRMRPDQGMDAAAFQQALYERAVQATRLVPGTTIQQNLAAGAELRTILNGPRNAVEYMPSFQMIGQALARASGADPDGMTADLARALSNRGSFNNQMTGEPDAERGMRELQMAGRMMFAFRNKGVNPAELNLFQRRARVMGERMAPEAYFGGWTASGIQNLGGNVFGTALNAFGRQMVNGIMPKEQAEFLKRYGLLAPNAQGARVPEREIRGMLQRQEIDEEEATRLRSGASARFNRRNIVNSDLAAVRPDLYFDWLVKHLEGRGIRTQDERDSFANAAGSTNTGRQLFSFGLNPAAQRADIAAVSAVDWDLVERFVREGYAGSLNNMLAGITNATASLGESSTGDLVKLMNNVAEGLNNLGEWARKNPDQARILVDLGIGLTALATAGALFAAGSLAIGGLVAMGGALTGLAAPVITGGLALLSGPVGLAALAGGIAYLAFAMEGKDWKALFDGVTSGIKGMWDALKAQTGMGPNGTSGSAVPTPPGFTAPRPGMNNGMPDFRLPGQRSSLDGGGWNFAGVVPPSGGETVVHTVVELDGRKVGESVTRHIERAISGPVQSAARFDGRRDLTSPSMA
jgi:hypothetical protein